MARSNQVNAHHAFTGVFLVGLGIVAWTDQWWPGIMFVVAISLLVKALIEGQLAANIIAVAVLTGIGVLGLLGRHHLNLGVPIWPALFIVIGVAYLVKTFWKRSP